MAKVQIHLNRNENEHDVRECLCKALSDDSILIAKEHYNDELMEEAMDELEDYYSKIYLEMMKEVTGILMEEI